MPIKSTNKQLIKDFIKHKKEEGTLSQQTIKNYTNIGDNIPFNILTTQPTIIKKLKDLYKNLNTLLVNLNLVIVVRKYNEKETDKLIKFRNSLRDTITKKRKDDMADLNDDLPTYETIKERLDNLQGILYIVNYLIFYVSLRNADINLKYIKTLPEKLEENYIQLNKDKITLTISNYKTSNKYGTKKIIISSEKFINEFKNMNLDNEEYILSKKDNSKISNVSTFNEKILKLSIDKLSQKLVKIYIKHLLKENDFKKLEEASKNRGTSLSVLLTSYNLMNNK
tara:strand:+ start:430 stop:1275 length:846 start_codon:yes stop_codon:yes gene_type:complete